MQQLRSIHPLPIQPTEADIEMALQSLIMDHNRDIGLDKIAHDPFIAFDALPLGFSAIATSLSAYQRIAGMCACRFNISGTSDSTAFTLSLPFPARVALNVGPHYVKNSGTAAFTGLLTTAAGSTTLTITNSAAGGAFTNSGTKALSTVFIYEPL